MKNIFDTNNAYDRNGMLNGDGLMTLSDMHDTLTRKCWDRDAAIAFVVWNHSCSQDDAIAKIDWAISIFKKEAM